MPRIVQKKGDGNSVTFTISPLPQGFGNTLGNSLRRVLLSSIPGAAVVAFKMDGVSHEYTTVAGLKDSVLDLALNLKRIVFRKTSKDAEVFKLSKKGEGPVTAGEISLPTGVEILNPDCVLTVLDKKNSKIDLEIKVEKGVGYLQSSEREEKEVGWILIDALFSPVVHVDYRVLPARVGEMTNLDKLEVEVKTNGSLTAEESVKFAAQILQSYFKLFQKDEDEFIEEEFFVDFDRKKQDFKKTKQKEEEEEKESYTPIEVLNLSPRTLNALINGDIGSVEELVNCSYDKLDTMRGFGKKAMTEVEQAVAARGLTLG